MNGSKLIGVLIADEHAMCREALRNLLEREPGFAISGDAADGDEAFRLAVMLRPDILLLDLGLPRFSAVEVLRRLQECGCEIPVLILAESIDVPRIVESLKFGARGFVLKESSPEVLFKSIRAVTRGEYWIGRSMIGDLVRALRDSGSRSAGSELHPAPFSLTRRELEIIAEVAEGGTNRSIAEKLSIAEQTVKHHLTSIFQKVGVSNRLELAVFAMHRGIHGNSSSQAGA